MMTTMKKRKSPASRKMKRTTRKTRKRSDNPRLSLHARIFSAFRIILQALNRNGWPSRARTGIKYGRAFFVSGRSGWKDRTP
jgi:hypothetical protein